MSVSNLDEARARLRRAQQGGFSGGPKPPDNGDMEARVAKLEQFAQDTRERLVRIETKLDHAATKTDVSGVEGRLAGIEGRLTAEVHKAINEQTWRLIRWVAGISGGLVAVTYFVVRHLSA